MNENALKSSQNFKTSIHNVVDPGMNFAKKKNTKKWLLAVLGSQFVVVKCTSAKDFFLYSRLKGLVHR